MLAQTRVEAGRGDEEQYLGIFCESRDFKFADSFVDRLDKEWERNREGKGNSRAIGLSYQHMEVAFMQMDRLGEKQVDWESREQF